MTRLLVSILLALTPISARAGVVLVPDNTSYRSGQTVHMAGPWGAALDPNGNPHIGLISVDGARSTALWTFPARVASVGVWGYYYRAIGQYWDIKPQVAWTPRQLGGLKTFVVNFSVSQSGPSNVLFEFFATARPGDISTRRAEVGWLYGLIDPATLAFHNYGTLIGSYKNLSGSTWECRRHPLEGVEQGYTTCIRSSDRTPIYSASTDIKSGVDFLISKGVINPAWWLNGSAIGFEPLRGSGAGSVDQFDMMVN